MPELKQDSKGNVMVKSYFQKFAFLNGILDI